jgi:nucleoside-diphosphate-sugar epimerase
MSGRGRGAILITGSSGFLGSLVTATALVETNATLVLPLRTGQTREAVVARIARELEAEGRLLREEDLARLVMLPLRGVDCLDELSPMLGDLGVEDVLHCAGCLSYFDVARLQEGNIELTRGLLSLATRLGARRFVFLSTAYSSGFVDGPIPEALHDGPRADPTDYTRTKREAEWLVAESGLPFVIVRPSIVIGDSRDGRYGGKPYGVYQLWTSFERYLSNGVPPVLHVVAGDEPVNFLHQDAFKAGFWSAYQDLPDGSIVHLASREEGLPTMRDLWRLWTSACGGPAEVHLHDRLENVPLDELSPQLRLWLDFTAVNSEIASVRWNFQLGTLERLRQRRIDVRDVTPETMRIVQARFLADSKKLQDLLRRHRRSGGPKPLLIVHPRKVAQP